MARPDPDTIFGDPAFDTANYSHWMTIHFTKLERRGWELQSQSPDDELDVLVFDLRLARGASIDSLDVDGVIGGATMFSRKRPRALVAHLDDARHYPVSYARPQVRQLIAQFPVTPGRHEVIAFACTGDVPPTGRRRAPPGFSHQFAITTFHKLMEVRAMVVNGQKPDGVEKSYSEGFTPEMGRTRAERRACGACGKADGGTMKACAGCKQVVYCDSVCQKAAWKGHKAACRKYQRAAADVAAQYRKLNPSMSERELDEYARDQTKNLSEAGLDNWLTPEQSKLFQEEFEVFRQHATDPTGPQLVSSQMSKLRCTKFGAPDFGDSAEAVRAKGLAGTRKLYCEFTHAGFSDFLERMYTDSNRRREGGKVGIQALHMDEADIRALWATGDKPVDVKLNKLLKDPRFDPRTHFIVRFEDRAIGPNASALMLAEFGPLLESEIAKLATTDPELAALVSKSGVKDAETQPQAQPAPCFAAAGSVGTYPGLGSG